MDANWKTSLWGQFGAAIDMLDNAMPAPLSYGASGCGMTPSCRPRPSSGTSSITPSSGSTCT